MNRIGPKIVVIGGGTGSFTLLSELKHLTSRITALVNMTDNGGSTGILRDQFGVLPPGDVRQCLIALSQSSQSLRELFNYRFPAGTELAGHSFGNLFLTAVEMMSSDFGEAVKLASEVLTIKGKVVPITLTNCHLTAKIGKRRIKGEYAIATTEFNTKKAQFFLEPKAFINPEATKAIANADLIVIAPGNLYGSLVPALLTEGVPKALQSAKCPIVYVCNLVNKPIHTKHFAVHDYLEELERFVGTGTIGYVLYNADLPSDKLLAAYALDGEYPVPIDYDKLNTVKLIKGNFLQHTAAERNTNDSFILRSLIRHDAKAIAKKIMELANEKV